MSYQLELRHLRYFLAVAEDLHFGRAAERLFISQPGLSKQIKEMEEGIGFQLFDRHNRKVELTPAGTFLMAEIKRITQDLEQTVEQARLISEGLDGDLKLGYVGSAMQQVIPDLLMVFRAKFPKVLFTLKEMGNQEQIEGLLARELDIGFIRSERVPRGLEMHPVLNEPFCLVLPTTHSVTQENFESLSQLREESFILFDSDYSPSYFEKVMQIFDDQDFVPHVTHNTIHSTSIFKLVEKGFGVSIVPESLQLEQFAGVKFISLAHLPQRTVLSAVWHRESRNPILRNLLGEIWGVCT